MRLNAKGTVGSFGGRKLIYNNKIISQNVGGGASLDPRSASGNVPNRELLNVIYQQLN